MTVRKPYRRVLAPILLFAVLLPLHSLCAQGITIAGSGSDLGTFKRLISAFEQQYPEDKLTLLPSIGSGGAIKALANGVIDLGLLSREPKPQERSEAFVFVHYANTPLAFVVRAGSPVSAIDQRQLRLIYAGRSFHWPDGVRARPVLRPLSDSDSRQLIQSLVDFEPVLREAYQRQGMPLALTDQDAVKMVHRIPGAIGTATLAQILSEGLALQVLSLDGVVPSVGLAQSRHYPIHKPLYLVYAKQAQSPVLDRFISFIRSEQGQGILLETGHDALPWE